MSLSTESHGIQQLRRVLTISSIIHIFEFMNIQPDSMLRAAGAASDLLKAIASPNRLMLLCQLIDGERSVGDLAQRLSLRSPTVSQHLALLRKDGLVATRREGQTIYYAIASPAARAVIETLYGIYCAPECGSDPEKPTPSESSGA